MHIRIALAVIIATFMIATAVSADNVIYTWTDENGVQHMSNIPPVDSDIEIEVLETKPPQIVDGPGVQATPKPKEKSSKKKTTKFSVVKNHVIVPVTISYKKKKVRANLLLDTGATNITLHRYVAEKLKVKKIKKGAIRVAGGDLIEADGVILDSVTVGPHTKINLLAGIIDHSGAKVPYDGLLGMNFLKSFPYTIDFNKKLLHWKN
jgi:hypothetical protein